MRCWNILLVTFQNSAGICGIPPDIVFSPDETKEEEKRMYMTQTVSVVYDKF